MCAKLSKLSKISEPARGTAPRTDDAASVTPLSFHPQNNILTPTELADRLKVKTSWVYEKTRGRNRDRLPFVRLGRYVRFYWTDVVDWLKAHRVAA